MLIILCQILNVKNRVLPHKSKLGQTLSGGMDVFASVAKGHQEATAFISAAEMVKKFQSKPRDIELSQSRSFSHVSYIESYVTMLVFNQFIGKFNDLFLGLPFQVDSASVIQRRPKLTLTRPKEPELETAHRVRAVRIKSSAELEEEMLAKIPKFKARPVNKKVWFFTQ